MIENQPRMYMYECISAICGQDIYYTCMAPCWDVKRPARPYKSQRQTLHYRNKNATEPCTWCGAPAKVTRASRSIPSRFTCAGSRCWSGLVFFVLCVRGIRGLFGINAQNHLTKPIYCGKRKGCLTTPGPDHVGGGGG